jgi:hypothetical protein
VRKKEKRMKRTEEREQRLHEVAATMGSDGN